MPTDLLMCLIFGEQGSVKSSLFALEGSRGAALPGLGVDPKCSLWLWSEDLAPGPALSSLGGPGLSLTLLPALSCYSYKVCSMA